MAPHPAESRTYDFPCILCHEEALGFFMQAEFIEWIQRVGWPPVLETVPMIDIKNGSPVDIGNCLEILDPCSTVGDSHRLIPFNNEMLLIVMGPYSKAMVPSANTFRELLEVPDRYP